MYLHRTFGTLLLTVYTLSGCGVVDSRYPVEAELDELVAAVELGVSDATAVRAALGKPLAASPNGDLEVFRPVLGRDVNYYLLLGIPWTTHFHVRGYVVVRYGDGGLVSSVSRDYFVEPNDEFRDRAHSALVEDPPYLFWARMHHTWFEEVLALNSPSEAARPEDGVCHAVLVCQPLYRELERRLLFNDTEAFKFVCAAPQRMVQFSLSTGDYKVEVTYSTDQPQSIDRQLECESGEVFYLYEDIEVAEWQDRTSPAESTALTGNLSIGHQPPSVRSDTPLVIFHSRANQSFQSDFARGEQTN